MKKVIFFCLLFVRYLSHRGHVHTTVLSCLRPLIARMLTRMRALHVKQVYISISTCMPADAICDVDHPKVKHPPTDCTAVRYRTQRHALGTHKEEAGHIWKDE